MDQHDFEQIVTRWIKSKGCANLIHLIDIKLIPLGAADTVYQTLMILSDRIHPSSSILCCDGDVNYNVDVLGMVTASCNSVLYFNETSDDTSYSFLEIDDGGYATDIVEKIKISNHACTGAYHFENKQEYIKAFKSWQQVWLNERCNTNTEMYLSSIIKHMLASGRTFKAIPIKQGNYNNFGTPLDVMCHCKNHITFNKHHIVFEIGNGIISSMNSFIRLIDLLVHHSNHVTLVMSGNHATHVQLKLQLRYHVYQDKITYQPIPTNPIPTQPSSTQLHASSSLVSSLPIINLKHQDIVNPNTNTLVPIINIEKALGYYTTSYEIRSFNMVRVIDNVAIKSGSSLAGEIYWYLNCPSSISHLFPTLLDYDDLYGKTYTMTKVEGIPLNNLLITNTLTVNLLDRVIAALETIHDACRVVRSESGEHDACTDLNVTQDLGESFTARLMYDNYIPKIKQRIDLEALTSAQRLYYDVIVDNLITYTNNDLGICQVIHGDPVLSNIIINTHSNVKFIDMRGSVGSTFTILGDVMYDWAKLYQSLIGYHEIINDIAKADRYDHSHLIDCLKQFFITKYDHERWGHLQYITASLVMTLMPLHNDCYHQEFWKLIECLIGN
ncbi:Hypothetical protein MVR_LOCUS196 [uncultured virus]|nr:Hypothetical protein MVR_LOCUS196 [uncultured virus]